MSDELRACWNCGGSVHIKHWDDDSTKECTVECDKYNCPGGMDYWSDEQDVIAKWNTRPLEDAQAAEIERWHERYDWQKKRLTDLEVVVQIKESEILSRQAEIERLRAVMEKALSFEVAKYGLRHESQVLHAIQMLLRETLKGSV